MRVVIDTSTLVSAIMHATSIPHRAWLKAQRECEVLASRETFAELELVLHRKRLQRFISLSTRDLFLSGYSETVEWVAVAPWQLQSLNAECRDSKDVIFLALAQAAQADLIISSDQDLLVLHPWRSIRILTPAQFLSQSNL